MSSPWDSLVAPGGPPEAVLNELLSGTSSSLLRAFEGDSGGLSRRSRSVPEPDQKPPPVEVPDRKPAAGSFVPIVLVASGVGVDVCGGKIGESKFCVLRCAPGDTSCGMTIRHAKLKADIQGAGYYICAPTKPKGVAAFCLPVLAVPPEGLSILTRSVIEDPIPRRVSDWREIFNVFNGLEEFDESEKQEVLERIQRKVTMMPTPMKPRTSRESPDSLESWENEPGAYSTWLVDVSEHGSSEDCFNVMRTHWNDVVQALTVHRRSMERIGTLNHDVMQDIDSKLMKVIATIGDATDDIPAPDLWTSVTASATQLTNITELVEGHVESLESVEFKQRVMDSRVDNVVKLVDVKMNEVASLVTSQLEAVTNRVGSVDGHLTRLSSDVNMKVFPIVQDVLIRVGAIEGNGGGSRGGHEVRMEVMSRTMEGLAREIASMKAGAPTSGNAMVVQPRVGLEDIVASLVTEVETLKATIRVVQQENITLRQGGIQSGGTSFGGFDFSAKNSYLEFIVQHSEDGYYGASYDFVSFMECAVDMNRTSDEVMKSRKTLKGLGYDDLASSRIDTSFATLIPKMFGKEQDAKDPSKKMERLTTMDVWDHPSTQSGVKEDIEEFMVTYAALARGQIDTHFDPTKPAYQFFNVMVDNIVLFWNHFHTWITRFEREMAAQCSGGDDMAIHKAYVWKLICWMMHSLFKEMQKRRAPGAKNAMENSERTPAERHHKAASILEGAIAGQKFMAELIKDGFIRHPIFASTMIEFMLKTKASQATVAELIKKHKASDARMNGIQTVVDRLLSKGTQPGGGAAGRGGAGRGVGPG